MENAQYTLFLWLRGAFPRRIAYQLLLKGIVASPEDMLAGRTILSNFNINIATMTFPDTGPIMVDSDPSDPKPQEKSTPCLRIRHADGREDWINESAAILFYIEDAFPNFKSLAPHDTLKRAQAIDLITQINLLGVDFTYYLRHAAPVTSWWTELPDEDRSLGAARNALHAMTKTMVKLQDGASRSLDETGWLTLGVDGPGIIDVALAANHRYLNLSYEFDCLEDERLDKMRAWWKRFTQLEWWDGFEEAGEVHPPQMRWTKEVREVKNVHGG
ncbi:hypothetical protein FALBO_10908 [Fusarium albosuccineum]|uniref:GST N-terminal domain-containing protein n=1 Tax=Fusarium albosuccineum TaxID=1237068 RepID=A0A8H4L4S1_9HYPO|nr:hypothetical protein FALBO_10908 [Fusarium albosuccineum]